MALRGRPPLTEEQVRAKAHAYCQRYHVTLGDGGLPPFPSGKRETRQHREWLTVYRAHQRLERRTAPSSPDGGRKHPPGASNVCPICARRLAPVQRATHSLSGKPEVQLDLHQGCSDLLRLAEAAGPETLARIAALLLSRDRQV